MGGCADPVHTVSIDRRDAVYSEQVSAGGHQFVYGISVDHHDDHTPTRMESGSTVVRGGNIGAPR